jgi:hypothetical protein
MPTGRLRLVLIITAIVILLVVTGSLIYKQQATGSKGPLNSNSQTTNNPPPNAKPFKDPSPDEQRFEGLLVKIDDNSFVIKDQDSKEMTFKYLKRTSAEKALDIVASQEDKNIIVYAIKSSEGEYTASRVSLKSRPK